MVVVLLNFFLNMGRTSLFLVVFNYGFLFAYVVRSVMMMDMGPK